MCQTILARYYIINQHEQDRKIALLYQLGVSATWSKPLDKKITRTM